MEVTEEEEGVRPPVERVGWDLREVTVVSALSVSHTLSPALSLSHTLSPPRDPPIARSGCSHGRVRQCEDVGELGDDLDGSRRDNLQFE